MASSKFYFHRLLSGQLWKQETEAVVHSNSWSKPASCVSKDGCPVYLSKLSGFLSHLKTLNFIFILPNCHFALHLYVSS